MGSPYPSQTASGYNASPPADDGSVTAANKVKYATLKSQLGDPVKGLADNINTKIRTALNVTPTSQNTNYSTTVTDHLCPIEVTGTTTISLGDAATMVAQSMGYQVPIINIGTGLVTVALVTAANTLNGVANGTITVPPYSSVVASVNSTSNGYNVTAAAKPYRQGADIASAATVNLDNASDGDYVHVTGTTTITAITLQKGDSKTVEFTGALTLTNGASLVLPGGANITTAAGDTAIFRGEASGVVRCVLYQPANGRQVVGFSPITAALGANVSTSTAGTFVDGPSVAQGTSGTWFASGQVTLNSTTQDQFDAKLWDGTTVIAVGSAFMVAAADRVTISLSGYLATPAGNLRITVRDNTSNNGSIKANDTGVATKDSVISAIRIA